MKAYMVAQIEVSDWDVYKEYAKRTPPTIDQYGGKFIARGAAPEMLEGAQETRRMVIIEFPSADHARDWYNSDGYQALKKIRADVSEGQFLILDGFSDDQWMAALTASRALEE